MVWVIRIGLHRCRYTRAQRRDTRLQTYRLGSACLVNVLPRATLCHPPVACRSPDQQIRRCRRKRWSRAAGTGGTAPRKRNKRPDASMHGDKKKMKGGKDRRDQNRYTNEKCKNATEKRKNTAMQDAKTRQNKRNSTRGCSFVIVWKGKWQTQHMLPLKNTSNQYISLFICAA